MLKTHFIETMGLILGGLAIFVYGIHMMGDALKSIAGTKIREYIEKYTRNLFMSIMVGTVISALLHSSSAVTVISISLVRAGLMGLKQAIGITIGANIGTCVTSIMIGLDIEQFAYYFVAIGIAVMLLAKRKKISYVGKVLAGFGLIFVGLQMMSQELVLIAQQDWFMDVMLVLSKQPWFGFVGATIATAIMQSSTAVIGIVQKLYVTGVMTPAAGSAFIFGANVGTCMTALLASLGGSVPTKRAAWFHAVYNLLGALLGMILIVPFVQLVQWINHLLSGGAEMYIAQAHFVFNVISTIIVIPFVEICIRLLKMLIPGEDMHDMKIENIDQLDDQLIEKFPAGALVVAKKNTMRMGRNVLENMNLSLQYLVTHDQEVYDEVIEIEALVNKYDAELSLYLLKIAKQPTLSEEQTQDYYITYQVIKYLEQLSDQVLNICDFYKMVYEEKGQFSDGAIEDISALYEVIKSMLEKAMYIYDQQSIHDLKSLNEISETLHHLILTSQQHHFERMCEHICTHSIAASVLLDIYSHIERIGDLSLNIANRTFVPYKKHEQKYLDPDAI